MTEWEAHDKRIWSVDFSHLQPQTFVSGSDDGTVKVLGCLLVQHPDIKSQAKTLQGAPQQLHHAEQRPAVAVLALACKPSLTGLQYCCAFGQSGPDPYAT